MVSVGEWRDLWGRVGGGWLAADGFSGLAHPDGRYMFVHGDTLWELTGPTSPDRWVTRNSVTVWDPAEGEIDAVDPTGRDFIPAPGDGSWFWHGDPVWDYPDVWLFALRARAVEGGWGFTTEPRSLVQLSWPSFADPRWVATWEPPWSGFIDWGASMIRYGDWVYVYGVRHQPSWFGHDVFVARVRSGHLKDRSWWRFYGGLSAWSADGLLWSKDEAKAVPVIDHTAGTCGTFSSDLVAGEFRITSKLHGDLGSQVCVWSSRSPAGPWSRRVVAEAPWTSADQTYGAFAHPDLPSVSDGGSSRLVSVNHNSDVGLAGLFAEPWRYRPSWHPVEW